MKQQQRKIIRTVCSVLLAAALCACGKAPAPQAAPSNPAVPQQPAQEQSATNEPTVKEKALAAYRQILQAAPAVEGQPEEFANAAYDYEQNHAQFGDHVDMFALYDIDQNGVPELITLSVVNFRWTPVSVYIYADGAAVLLKDPADMAAHGTFEQYSGANGAYSTYICGDKHIHSVWRGTNPMGGAEEENHAFALAGTTLTAVDCMAGEGENTVNFYDIAKANTPENVAAALQ